MSKRKSVVDGDGSDKKQRISSKEEEMYEQLLAGYAYRAQAEEYLNHIHKESRTKFIDGLMAMSAEERKAQLDKLFHDDPLEGLETAVYGPELKEVDMLQKAFSHEAVNERVDQKWKPNLPFSHICPACSSKQVSAMFRGPDSSLRCDQWHMWWAWSPKLIASEEDAGCSYLMSVGPANYLQFQQARITALQEIWQEQQVKFSAQVE